jgi:hypothetical protein
MKTVIIIIISIFISHNLFGQRQEEIKKIIISDSLFNLKCDSNSYDFYKKDGIYPEKTSRKYIHDINDIIKLDNDDLNFWIGYGCGCGRIETKLVTNGIIEIDKNGNYYYRIKFYFKTNNECLALCIKAQHFDISELYNQQTPLYLKFEEFDQLIKIK